MIGGEDFGQKLRELFHYLGTGEPEFTNELMFVSVTHRRDLVPADDTVSSAVGCNDLEKKKLDAGCILDNCPCANVSTFLYKHTK